MHRLRKWNRDISPVAVQHGRSGITQGCDRPHIAKVRENVTFSFSALLHTFSRRGSQPGFAQGVV